MSHSDQPVVPGISISAAGQATVDQSMTEVLFELALGVNICKDGMSELCELGLHQDGLGGRQ